MSTPKVIYIGGHGRSGTTIVDRVLSEVTGGFSAGEIHRFWAYGLARDWRCSCGVKLRNCDFWGKVLRQSFSESGCSEDDILGAWRTVARPYSLLSLWYPSLRSTHFQRQLSRYRAFLEVLYRTVSQRSDKRVIVDSSGSPLHGYILSGLDGIEVDMIHLVRDARGVAYSNQKRKPNPSNPKPSATMGTRPSLRVSMTWVFYNYLLEGLKSKVDRYELAKYEEIFDDPKSKMYKIADQMKCGYKKKNSLIKERVIRISLDHTGQGNPTRFNRGKIELETDRRWKRRISTKDNIIVTIFSCILLGRYGYL